MFSLEGDPVAMEFVSSLAGPGGNVTVVFVRLAKGCAVRDVPEAEGCGSKENEAVEKVGALEALGAR
jgi:hypothetical protein